MMFAVYLKKGDSINGTVAKDNSRKKHRRVWDVLHSVMVRLLTIHSLMARRVFARVHLKRLPAGQNEV